ncbi:hypothetical protein NYO98_09490 [Nocardioides sp. STR2]|uniref:Uncharacterized protein n=1 Tax=Nocardioides pini TaxID=2975053 RepID=A0ABT4CCG0_9ACTN|nr:hypothetical protein [Nocardioides pini]MCY4726511.1 hypothetical protein [Nocardioides pini]
MPLRPVEYVITSPLSLARVLWWYGEDELWGAALALTPTTVADLSPRFARLRAAPEVMDLLWPGGPAADAHLVLGVLEHLEGRPRHAARRTRRGSAMPDVLDVDEHERWRDPVLAEVLRLVHERTGVTDGPEPWQMRAVHGRYAPAWRILLTGEW